MRAVLALALFMLSAASAADSVDAWLDRAADASLTLRQREYAARQVLMLADSSASILIAAVRDDDSDSGLRRQVAAGLLGELRPATAEAALLEAAFDEEYFLAQAAANALARLYARFEAEDLYHLYKRGGREPGTVPGGVTDGDDWLVLTTRLTRQQSRFRAILLHAIELKFSESAATLPQGLAECVWDGLADADPDVRLRAAVLVPDTGSSQAPERLAAFLYVENDKKLLIAALRAMSRMRAPDYGEAVMRHTRHADPLVALEALAAMDAMGLGQVMFPSPSGERSVAGFITHPSSTVRRRAAELLGETRNPAALPYLTQALFDRVGPNRAAATKMLGELGFTGAVGALSSLLTDGRPEVREEAAVALNRFGVVGTVSRVVDDLQHAPLPFRRAAARALGRMDDGRAVKYLAAALFDADEELACLAAEALAGLAARDAGPDLYRAMTEAGDPVRADAMRQALTLIYRDDPGLGREGWEGWRIRNRVEGAGDHGRP